MEEVPREGDISSYGNEIAALLSIVRNVYVFLCFCSEGVPLARDRDVEACLRRCSAGGPHFRKMLEIRDY
ncbi:MAG: hypothetical protein P8Y60_11355 [Calditrichota bacterium]